jgi:hypothetical protein
MGRDILGRQKMRKVGSGIFLRIDSYDLHDNRFFVGNDLSFCFSLDRLLSLSRVMAVSSRRQILAGGCAILDVSAIWHVSVMSARHSI